MFCLYTITEGCTTDIQQRGHRYHDCDYWTTCSCCYPTTRCQHCVHGSENICFCIHDIPSATCLWIEHYPRAICICDRKPRIVSGNLDSDDDQFLAWSLEQQPRLIVSCQLTIRRRKLLQSFWFGACRFAIIVGSHKQCLQRCFSTQSIHQPRGRVFNTVICWTACFLQQSWRIDFGPSIFANKRWGSRIFFWYSHLHPPFLGFLCVNLQRQRQSAWCVDFKWWSNSLWQQ
jgi:hypothetical protein